MLFYASPILYVDDAGRPEDCQQPVHRQPARADPDPDAPRGRRPDAPTGAPTAIGGGARLLIPLAIVVGAFALGLWAFNREAPRIAENL